MFCILQEGSDLTNLEIKAWLSALDAVERRIKIKYLDKKNSQILTPKLDRFFYIANVVANAFVAYKPWK